MQLFGDDTVLEVNRDVTEIKALAGAHAALVRDLSAAPVKFEAIFNQSGVFAGIVHYWQIYSRRCLLQIHFLQCGYRCFGGGAISSRMAWRTAGRVG